MCLFEQLMEGAGFWLIMVGPVCGGAVSGCSLGEEEAAVDNFCTHCHHPYLDQGKTLPLP